MGRVLVWLLGALLVLGSTITGLNMLNPLPVDPGSPMATETEDGHSRFTPAGVDFIEQRGELTLRIGGESGPAAALGLPTAGGHRVAFESTIDAHLMLPQSELVIEDIERIEFFMRDNRVSSVEITYAGKDMGRILRIAGFSPSDLGIREEGGVRIGARLADGQLEFTVRALD
jgi:hypothetical protein